MTHQKARAAFDHEALLSAAFDHEALLNIQELMDNVVWTPDTLNEIADAMQRAGYRIRDVDDSERAALPDLPLR
jgi:hypothetical protein